MAQLKFKFLSETKYNSLPAEEQSQQGVLYCVRGNDASGNSLYLEGVKYASSSDTHYIKSENELPKIGEKYILYITKNGNSYIWNDESLEYVCMGNNSWDEINGGNATS